MLLVHLVLTVCTAGKGVLMAAIITKYEDDKGWSFDMTKVKTDLFHLISIFLSDPLYAENLSDENDPLWELASIGESEITRILINTAAIGRVIDDRENFYLPKDSC